MAMFKKGDAAQLKVDVPSGIVAGMRMDDEGNVECLLEWVTADGEVHQRWFDEGALVAGE